MYLELRVYSIALATGVLLAASVVYAEQSKSEAFTLTRSQVIEKTMRPYTGPHVRGVDPSTLVGKVMCGYQGWFTCPGDGSGRGWFHWGKGAEFRPGACTIDFWPDVSELDQDERYPTAFKHADGSVAQVFSSMNSKTVLRHFKWMRDYGLDGVFVQRFAVETRHVKGLNHCNVVLNHCREGANRYGRIYALMYDLSGLKRGQMRSVIEDWKLLIDRMQLGRDSKDKAYLHHKGKPVVAVWGIGFNDRRDYTLDECAQLFEFLKHDPKYGGNTVMVGVPSYWRTLNRDCVKDAKVHEVVLTADIVSPWAVGRFGTLPQLSRYAQEVWVKDLAWCQQRGKDYLPVVFPGFSWHNMKPESQLNVIPRQKGRFLWQQYVEAKKAGATMIYQAMFDEVDEGTAIFKCTNNPPVGDSPFLSYEGLPTDHYLWLVGSGGKMLRGEIAATDGMPEREPLPGQEK